MNKILHRGKRREDGAWVEGNYVFQYDCHMIYLPETGSEFGYDHYHVSPETVCRYIGREDRLGVKIFEGDIVDASAEWWDAAGPAGHKSPIIKVEWDDSICGFVPFALYDCDCAL